MTDSNDTLPSWDLSPFYSSIDAPEVSHEIASIGAHVLRVSDMIEAQNDLATADPGAVDQVLNEFNQLLESTHLLGAFIAATLSVNTADPVAQAKMSEFEQQKIAVDQLDLRFTCWVGTLDIAAVRASSEQAKEHEFVLSKRQTSSQHMMSAAEEHLAASLTVTGSNAWSKLHSDITSQIVVPFEVDNRHVLLSMSAIRNLAFDHNAETRLQAYESELKAWKQNAVPLAAALNGIKGEVLTLSKRRKWSSPLAQALFGDNISEDVLDAMMAAARESFPDFRRYLALKSNLLRKNRLGWPDLFAPVGDAHKPWQWRDAQSFLSTTFGAYSPKLQGLADRAFRERWIDASPGLGKVGGAYCEGFRREESRILTNFKSSFDGVSTLAHELGHAYHNLCLANRTPLQQETPMALAETASIFCETIIRNAALNSTDAAQEVTLLDASLQGATQVIIDISSRFEFEKEVFSRRAIRELAAEEFCEIMVQAQESTYGAGLDQNLRHPYMWAVKGHYYSTQSFYNYPYMFGMLFALGLYHKYQQEPDGFVDEYDRLLSGTGITDPFELAQRFSIDIKSIDFWRSSLNIVRSEIDRFDQLTS